MSASEERAKRIVAAAVKIRNRLEAHPQHPKAPGWKRKLKEYEASLENLKRFGVERPGSGRTGVQVEVPKGVFGVTSQNPEG